MPFHHQLPRELVISVGFTSSVPPPNAVIHPSVLALNVMVSQHPVPSQCDSSYVGKTPSTHEGFERLLHTQIIAPLNQRPIMGFE